MPRILRSLLPDGFFHVIARGVDGTDIFREDGDRLDFLAAYAAVATHFSWEAHVLCLMTNHYHFVVEAEVPALSRGMQRLNGDYALGFNRKYDRVGHLFGARFTSRVITSERYLAKVCRYVVNNPVRAGLCDHPAEWRWSFCRYGFDLD